MFILIDAIPINQPGLYLLQLCHSFISSVFSKAYPIHPFPKAYVIAHQHYTVELVLLDSNGKEKKKLPNAANHLELVKPLINPPMQSKTGCPRHPPEICIPFMQQSMHGYPAQFDYQQGKAKTGTLP